MKKIAILVSGTGTNAERIIQYFKGNDSIQVASVISDRDTAQAITRLAPLGVKVEVFPRPEWKNPVAISQYLQDKGIDLIVLAGFLSIIAEPLLTQFSGRIVNIHPSLLPKHGGPGMWGKRVHEAVLASGDKASGITIHLVDALVDGGRIVERHSCPVLPGDTPSTLAARVHLLEYRYYPTAIEHLLS